MDNQDTMEVQDVADTPDSADVTDITDPSDIALDMVPDLDGEPGDTGSEPDSHTNVAPNDGCGCGIRAQPQSKVLTGLAVLGLAVVVARRRRRCPEHRDHRRRKGD